ncbi:AAA family ATPase [Janibacter indicus]|uniref:AAA family ATPase n=1 Tax=Janibacter indicus TaxID=857417 RepID=UPI003D9A2324
MRLTKVELNGYKRMLATSCNLDADVIALVGPNEAGKTTVLEALEWLSSGERLDQRKVNRTVGPGLSGPVVTAVFALETADRDLLTDVETDDHPTSVLYSRYQDGHDEVHFAPSLTRRSHLAVSIFQMLSEPSIAERIEAHTASQALPRVIDLAKSGREWEDGDQRLVDTLVNWLELPITGGADDEGNSSASGAEPTELPPPESDLEAAELLKDWQQQMSKPHPEAKAGDVIRDHLPAFLMFSEADRELGFEHDLRPRTVTQGGQSRRVPSESVEQPDGGLANLLTLAGTSIRTVYELVQQGVPERTSALVRKVNKRLNETLSPYWRQRDLRVRLDVSDTTLRVFIDDGEDVARFTDRSDGLRTFVALIAFLAQHASDPPPVLLIDEADTHLHYNAQADLINFLQELPSRTIYTTHSPGCLPLDLGTGIRVVRPHPEKAISELSNTFWEEEAPGFSSLLFAMGAGAAAFSAVRAAVFTEGPSDMILLPRLIREATGERVLGYQIVPGLANIHPRQLGDAEYAAIRVAYLLDGDGGGDQHAENLKKAMIPPERILRLPDGVALEDLVEPDAYLEALNGVLSDSGRPEKITREQVQAALDEGTPIAKAAQDVLGGQDNTPSKVAVAGRLLRHDGPLPLTREARDALSVLHASLTALLETPK